MPRVGDVLEGKYRLERLIGSGGMGEVFLAEHLRIGKRVAVKCLYPNLADDAGACARLEREAKSAATVGHTSIVDIHDVGATEEGSLFLVMEHLVGESLAQLLDRRDRLDISTTAYIACQVLSALDAAHDRGVVHRDLKPDNIFLVDARQSLPLVKLMDFGISKIITPGDTKTPLTATGAVLGTPHYMSPEQAMGQKDIDYKSDLYAMGVVLYRCLTGQVPFTADNYLALIHVIAFSDLVEPREICPDIPVALENVLLKALSKDREARYATAALMFDALYPFIEVKVADWVSVPVAMERGPDGRLRLGDPKAEQQKRDARKKDDEQPRRRRTKHLSRRWSGLVMYSGWVALAAVVLVVFLTHLLGSTAPTDDNEQPVAQPSPDGGGMIEPKARSVERDVPPRPEKTVSAGTESPTDQPSPPTPETPVAAQVVQEPTSKRATSPRPNKVPRPAPKRGGLADAGVDRGALRPKLWDGEFAESSSDEN